MEYENFEAVKKTVEYIEDIQKRLDDLQPEKQPKVTISFKSGKVWDEMDIDKDDAPGQKLCDDFISMLRIHYMDKIKKLKRELSEL